MDIWLSMLEHYAYCPRQCGLIHIEQCFHENVFTIRGNLNHERVHEAASTIENGIRMERAMPLWSDELNLVGIADLIEFRQSGPYPVEYKSGKKFKPSYKTPVEIQLCSQAICLEEMLSVRLEKGAVFFQGSKHRYEVTFDLELREKTFSVINAVRDMLLSSKLSKPLKNNKCTHCSLSEICFPELAEEEKLKKLYDQLFMD